MAKFVLALDQGTTSSRAILFDEQQNIVEMAQREFTQYYPKQGWVEHDPMEIYSSQYGVMMEVIAKSGVDVARHCCHRHCEPARNHGAVGQNHRQAHL